MKPIGGAVQAIGSADEYGTDVMPLDWSLAPRPTGWGRAAGLAPPSFGDR